jgi:cytochrome c553
MRNRNKWGDAFRAAVRYALLALGAVAASKAQGLEKAKLQDVIIQCAACHGADGVARDVEVPNLAGQHDRYLFGQLQAFKSGKRPHKEMRYMSRLLSDEEMSAIAQYYSNMPH